MQEVSLTELVQGCPDNPTILDALSKCHQQVNNHDRIMVSISGGSDSDCMMDLVIRCGGSDSDCMMDLVIRCGGKDKTDFVFFNTGLEYDATKRQLRQLEVKYDIKIQNVQPIKPIPVCVKEYGVPFWSKQVSGYIHRLQRHGFQWEDEPFDVLYKKYPRCKAALRWWCNDWPKKDNGSVSNFSIAYIPRLKEFMVANPPTFKISDKCCTYAKKEPANKYAATHDHDLSCIGVRKAEGGARSVRYSTCYTRAATGPDAYRPLFWFSDSDKEEYTKHYGVTHSDCYGVWGMKRTGCAGCPFGKEFEQELSLAQVHEPKFYKAMVKIFGDSYDYTRRFLEFREQMKNKK